MRKTEEIPEILIGNAISLLEWYPYRIGNFFTAMLLTAQINANAHVASAMALLRIAEALEKPTPQNNPIGFRTP